MSQPAPEVIEQPEAVTAPQEHPEQPTTVEKENKGVETPAEEEVVELDLSNIEKVNGEYVFKDPANPQKTLYHGKTVGELIQATLKGTVEKDKYISDLKARNISSGKAGNRRVEGEDDTEAAIEFPKPQEVLATTAKEMGLDISTLSWDEAKWKEFEAEHGTRETNKLSNLVDTVQKSAEARVAAANVDAMNKATLLDEEAEIRAIAVKHGIDVDSIDWDKLFDEALSDKKNYYKSGIRKSGAVVRAASDEILRVVKEEREEKLAEKIEKEILEGKRKGRKIASDGGSVKPSPKNSTKEAAKNTEEAYKRSLAAFK